MKILVTGATGFFGKKVYKSLQNEGFQVVGTSQKRGGPGVDEYETLNVTSVESCQKLFENHSDINTIVHCAGVAIEPKNKEEEKKYYNVNVIGIKNIIDKAIEFGVQNFIHISSVSVYGEYDLPDVVNEDSERKPTGLYGISKKEGEDCCIQRSEDINLYVFRMTTMYNKDYLYNIRRKVIPPLLSKFFYLKLDSKSKRYSLCSVENGVNAIIYAINNKMPAGIYNIADNYIYCLDDILYAVKKQEGPRLVLHIPRFFIDNLFKFVINHMKENEKMKSRHWKFLERNVYSTNKLISTGFSAVPHLLD